MISTGYEITVCDRSPIGDSGINSNLFKFLSERKAFSFARESLAQGHTVVMKTCEVNKFGLLDLTAPCDE